MPRALRFKGRPRYPLLLAAALVPLSVAAQTTPNQTAIDASRGATESQARRGSPAAQDRDVRASAIIGAPVRNLHAKKVAQVIDMIVNMDTGEARYAILHFDMLPTEKLYAVPTRSLTIAPSRSGFILDVGERIDRAAIDRATWGERTVAAEGFIEKLDQAWGMDKPSQPAAAHPLSDLIGKDVYRRDGGDIGEIQDVIIDMARQQVHYAVLALDPNAPAADTKYVVPLRSFEFTAGRDAAVIDLDETRMRAFKGFPDSRYSNLNDPTWLVDIDRYLVTVVPAPTGGGSGDAAASASEQKR